MKATDASLAKLSVLMLASLVIGGIISVLISIVVARSLSLDDFGMYSILVSTQGIVIMVAEFGMPQALAKFISEYVVNDRNKAIRVARLGLAVVAALMTLGALTYVALGGIIGNQLYNEPNLAILIPYSGLIVVSTTLLNAFTGIIQGLQKIRTIGLLRVATPALCFVLVVPLVTLFGIEGVFLGFFFGQLMVAVIVLRTLFSSDFRLTKVPIAFPEPEIRNRVLEFGLLKFSSGAIVVPVLWIGNSILLLTSDLSRVGYFSVAFVLYSSLIIIPSSIVIPLLPKISQLSIGSIIDLRSSIVDVLRLTATLLIPIGAIVILFSNWIVDVLYGSSYAAASGVLDLMVIASYYYALTALVMTLFTGMGRMRLYFMLSCMWAIAFLIVAFTMISTYDAAGLAAAFLVSYGFLFGATIVTSRTRLRVDLRETYPAVVLGSICLLSVFLVDLFAGPEPFLRVALATAIVIIVSWMSRKELLQFVTILRSSVRKGEIIS